MLLAWIISSTLFSFLQASSHQKHPSSLPLLSLYATQSGIVPLIRDNFGFYANVDLNSFISDASDTIPNPETVAIIPALYTNKTILTESCINFSPYICSNPLCNPFQYVNITRDLPHFTAQGYEAFALVYLDYNSWSLYDIATIATSCTTGMNTTYGSSRYGVIGLGIGEEASQNYLKSITLSVYIDKDLTHGQLYFQKNASLIASGSKQIVLVSDENWHIHEVTRLYFGTHNRLNLNSSIIFDLASDTIGLPLSIYDDFLNFFQKESVKCTEDYIRPTCNYTGLVEELPNVTLYVQKEKVTITPQIYLNATIPGKSITLNLRGLAPNLTGECYITSAYSNFIILDINFMSYYYVQFRKRYVEINLAASSLPQPPGSNITWVYIVAGILGLLVIVAVVACCYAYRKKKVKSKIQQESPKEGVYKSPAISESDDSLNI